MCVIIYKTIGIYLVYLYIYNLYIRVIFLRIRLLKTCLKRLTLKNQNPKTVECDFCSRVNLQQKKKKKPCTPSKRPFVIIDNNSQMYVISNFPRCLR